ncbi:pe-pgrs family protein, partial [Fusarium flagelliforme]
MFKFLPVLLFAIVGGVFARGYGDTSYEGHGKSQCVEWCEEHFRHSSKSCIYPASKGKGPCYDCGPNSTNPAKKLCYDGCKDTASDNANCGKCGNSCPSETNCVEGICICTNSKQPQCESTCPDYLSDPANCGQCGNACNADAEKCQAGSCVLNCPDGETQCGSSCVNTNTDPNNCGECGNVCSSGQCENGACVAPGCTGQTCETFTACGPGGTCVCASISDGRGFCVDGNQPCANLADCDTSNNCPSGFADACTNSASQASFEKVSGDTVGRRAGGRIPREAPDVEKKS